MLFPDVTGRGVGVVLEVGAWSALFPTDLTPRGVWWSHSAASKPKRYTDRSADPARAMDVARGPRWILLLSFVTSRLLALAIFALWRQCSVSRIHRVKLVSWIESSEMMYLVVSRDLVLMALQFGYSPQRH